MQGTSLGIGVMLLATSLSNVGAVVQKGAVDDLPPLEGLGAGGAIRAMLGSPRWLVGWVLGTIALVLNMVALGLADLSVIQPLNGVGMAVLAIFSRFYLGERLDGRALGGLALVGAGVALVGWVLPESRVFGTGDEILAAYPRLPAVAALLACGVLAAGAVAAALRPKLDLLRRPGIAGVLLALAAATCSVCGLTFSKGFFGLLGLEGLATLARPVAWLLLGLMLCLSLLALFLQQLSFQRGRAVVVTPVFAATSVVLPLGLGGAVFGEALPAACLGAVLLIAVGVVLLGAREPGTPGEGRP